MATLTLKPTRKIEQKLRAIKRQMLPQGGVVNPEQERARVRRERRTRVRETRKLLVEAFPAAFRHRGAEKIPLKVSIDKDILAAMPEMSGTRLRKALHDYTRGPTYLRNLVEGADRHNLDGSVAGKVTAREAAHAAYRLAKLNTKPPSS